YHSYSEMMDVLKEKNIQDVFARSGVAVDMRLPDEVLEKANADAQAYAKGVSLKNALNAELTTKQPPTEPIPELKTTGPKPQAKQPQKPGTNPQPPKVNPQAGGKPQPTVTPTKTEPKKPKAEPQPETKPTVLALLQMGKVTTFNDRPGKKYVVFKSQGD